MSRVVTLSESDRVEIRLATDEDLPACEIILRSLPDWFGIESSIQEYVSALPSLTTLVATLNEKVVGFLAVKFHFERSAEIYVLGVHEELHRKGIGTAMLDWAEGITCERGCAFLQVKTLGPSHPSEEYARTRQFYLARGFTPIEEFEDLWPGNPCLLMMKHLNCATQDDFTREARR